MIRNSAYFGGGSNRHCQVEAASGRDADDEPAAQLSRYRFPSEIISHRRLALLPFRLEFRDVEDLLAERGITVTYEAIRLWCRTFGLNYARRLRRRRGRQGDTWYLGRALREDPGAAAVSVACRGRGRRRPRHSRAVAAQSAGGHTVLPEAVETPRPRASPADHRQAAQLLGGAPYRDAVRDPQYPAVRKQSRRKSRINQPASGSGRCAGSGRPPICNGLPRCTASSRISSGSDVTCSGAAHHRLLRARSFRQWDEVTCAG